MLTFVTFKWETPGYRAKFTAEHVNTLARMVARHYAKPHRFICITDDAAGIEPHIETFPLWDDYASVPNPTGGGRPSCYRRLKLWSPDMGWMLGERFVLLDLDAVIVSDITSLLDRPEEVVMWKSPHGKWPYNGAFYMANVGARPQVWEAFDPVESPRATHRKGYRGSDQAWLSLILGPDEAAYTEMDGVYIENRLGGNLPANARVVFMCSDKPPWKMQQRWVTEHYR